MNKIQNMQTCDIKDERKEKESCGKIKRRKSRRTCEEEGNRGQMPVMHHVSNPYTKYKVYQL